MQEEPGFGSELVQCLVMDLAESRKQVASLNRRSALEKLATFILGFLTWTGEDTSLELELHMGGRTSPTISASRLKQSVGPLQNSSRKV